MSLHILDKIEIVPAILPINIGSARAGDVASLKNYGRCAIVFYAAAGPAGDDPVLTVEQCSSVAPSNAKALTFTRIDKKQGTLTAVGTWTTVTQAAANTYTDTTSAEIEKLYVIDFKAEDLDVDGGFDCVRLSVGDAGTATQIAAALYILHEPRYSVAGGESAIVD